MSAKKSEPSDFRKLLESISHRHDTRRVFDAFIRFAACCLAAQTRETEYLEEAKHWQKPELELFGKALGALIVEMETRPFEDILGGYYLEFALSSKGQQWNGEFHTPKTICDLMARMTLGDMASLPAEGTILVCEPACGAGAMILSLAEVVARTVRADDCRHHIRFGFDQRTAARHSRPRLGGALPFPRGNHPADHHHGGRNFHCLFQFNGGAGMAGRLADLSAAHGRRG